jgi:hypothetical protein
MRELNEVPPKFNFVFLLFFFFFTARSEFDWPITKNFIKK